MDAPEPLFFRQGEHLIWVERVGGLFSRQAISDYLAKTRQVQARFPQNLSAVIVAPDFEEGVRELLALVRIPIRFFQYSQKDSPSLKSGWLEEVVLREKAVELAREELPLLSNRLSREELREFIQLEIDLASGKYIRA